MIRKCLSYCFFLLFCVISAYSQNKLNIAVAEFDGQNVSAMDAIVVSNLLRTEIVKTDKFNVVDRNNMEQILAEQAFQMSGCTTQKCAVQMGKLLNVNKIIVGSVMKLGTLYLINANMIDVETGKIERSEKVKSNSLEELPDTTEYLAGMLTEDIIEKKEMPEKLPELKKVKSKVTKDPKTKKPKSACYKKFGIGLGYPYVSLIWHITKKLSLEPRVATDFDEILLFGTRLSLYSSKKGTTLYYGLGIDSFTQDAGSTEYANFENFSGILYEFYIGLKNNIGNNMSLNLDIGPAYIIISDEETGQSLKEFDLILNIGVQLLLF